MPEYIAQSGGTPVELDELRTILPNTSFGPEVLSNVSQYTSLLTSAGYSACNVTNNQSDITPAWNQTVQLGTASLVSGELRASWAAVAIASSEEADALTLLKEDSKLSIESDVGAIRDKAADFSSGTGGSDPTVSLKHDAETLSYLTTVLQAATNANTGATIRGADGSSATLTLAQLKYLCASVFETNQDLQDDKVVAETSIDNAANATAVQTAQTTFETSNPAPATT